MTWLLPSALAIAAVAVLVTVALHFIARSRPVAEPFPTARFIPERAIHARTRSLALTDVLLLLLRAAAIVLLGVAVAGPVFPAGKRVSRIVIADRSRAVGDAAMMRDSAHAYLRNGDQLVVFDSLARVVDASTVGSLAPSGANGSLSAALAAATRAAVRVAAQTDSIELVLVSPLAEEEVDAATAKIRAQWPGRIRVVRIPSAPSDSAQLPLEVSAPANDAVAAGFSLVTANRSPAMIRLVRGRTSPQDSAWARVRGHVLVHWPASDTSADWPHRTTIDAIGGVAANGATVVARFPRIWSMQGAALARWADGEPAVVEHSIGDGCIRDVGILIDDASDVTLRLPFRRFATEILQPCGGARATDPVSADFTTLLAGSGALAPARLLGESGIDASRWTPWLLALAALLLIVELALRRTTRGVE